MIVKTWRIVDPFEIKEPDFRWLQKNCDSVAFNRNDDPVYIEYQGRIYATMGADSSTLKCTTKNDKQEMLLKLKFSNRIILESWTNDYEYQEYSHTTHS